MRAGSRLFAQHGVREVALARITTEAGQRNASAVHYHFGGREGLVRAILELHSAPVHALWTAELDRLDAQDSAPSARRLVELLVEPLVAMLDSSDGREYLAICAQLVTSKDMPLVEMPVASAPAAARLGASLIQRTELPMALVPLRMKRAVALIYQSLADRAVAQAPLPLPLFTADLVDCVHAIVARKPSARTRSHL
jgi:AcrR family transcriptional regulator